MKNLIISLVFCNFALTVMIAQTGPPACHDFVTINRNYFECDGQLFYPLATGEMYTQSTYARDLLEMVRDCGGAGLCWWQFQEVWWTNPCSYKNDGSFHQDGYGLLKHGDAGSMLSGGLYINLYKPVVYEFENYLDQNGQPPAVNPGVVIDSDDLYSQYKNTDTNETAKNNEIRLLFHKNTSLLSCNVFPNPCKGKFTLSVQQSESEGCYVRVTDIMGNIILPEQNMNGSATAFDISAFGKGVYYIWVYFNNSIMVKKIICL